MNHCDTCRFAIPRKTREMLRIEKEEWKIRGQSVYNDRPIYGPLEDDPVQKECTYNPTWEIVTDPESHYCAHWNEHESEWVGGPK